MNQQLLTQFAQLKEFITKQPKKTKTIALITALIVVILSILIPLVLRTSSDRAYAILYQGLSVSEQNEILSVLYDLRKEVRVSDDGTIRVPASQVNTLKLQLSSMGYPRTALSYNVFTSNSGFMTTELEKKQYLIIDLQTRLEETLRQIEGVRRAIVTLNIPDNNTYIWQTNSNPSTASVLLDLDASRRLEPGQVQGVRNLVASAVPRMKATDVVVVDANTGIEISGQTSNPLDGNFLQIEFEKSVEQRIEEKVLNLLTMPYGVENVRVSASVKIDYDKMISEELQYIPSADGKGILERLEDWYLKSGSSANDPDSSSEIPIYVEGDNGEGMIERKVSAEYLVSTIKRQIEKNSAELKSASVSVVINKEELSETDLQNWVKVIARAVDIEDENVNVFNIYRDTTPVIPPVPPFNLEDYLLYIIIGGVVLALMIVSAIIMMGTKKKKSRKQMDALKAFDQRAPVTAPSMMTEANPMKATISQLQEFTKDNPEIAANLLRDMLKEDE